MSRTIPQEEVLKPSVLNVGLAKASAETPKASMGIPKVPTDRPKMSTETPPAAAAAPLMPEIDYQAFALASGATVKALLQASDVMMKGMMAVSQEMSEFANKRMHENMERSQSLLHCTDPSSAFGLQCDFAQKATQQYLEEAGRLMALATQLSGKCWEPLQTYTQETVARAAETASSEAPAATDEKTRRKA
jgi:phasin family protein